MNQRGMIAVYMEEADVATVKLVVDGARMAELLRSPTGPVGRHLIGRAEIVKQAARAKAPKKTGCLASSIVKRVEENPATGFRIRIVADTTPCSPERKSYSLYVHEGTRPHTIMAKGKTLAFYWAHGPTGPGMYYFQSVNHPGTKPVPFLRDALPLAAA
jgi:hypothetical protein